MWKVGISGLAQKVAAEQEPSANAVIFDVLNQLQPFEWCARANSDCKAEPTWIGVGGRLGQDECVFKLLEPIVQALPVVAAGIDKAREFLELGNANSGLHVGHFEVVANM